MSRDAIAYLAEPREIDKQSFREEGRNRGVQIGRLRELPQFVDDEGCIRSGAKEFGTRPKRAATSHSNASWADFCEAGASGNRAVIDMMPNQSAA